MGAQHILVVTGASAAGKTTAVRALDARGIAGVRCFYFDSIGVPSAEVMERDFGGAAYLRGQADARGLPIIDTTALTVAETADAIESLIRPFLRRRP